MGRGLQWYHVYVGQHHVGPRQDHEHGWSHSNNALPQRLDVNIIWRLNLRRADSHAQWQKSRSKPRGTAC